MEDEIVDLAIGPEGGDERGVEAGCGVVVDEAGFARGADERVGADSGAAGLVESAGEEEGDAGEVAGDDVVILGHALLGDGEDGEAWAAALHGGLEAAVGDALGFRHRDPPGLEEGGEGRRGGGAHLAHHRVAAGGHLGGDREGVDAGEDRAALEEVLVEGELGFRGDARGVEEEDDVDLVGIDLAGVHGEVLDLVGLAELAVDDPGLLAWLAGHHGWAAGDGEGGHDADDRLAGGADLGDAAGDLVFEHRLVVRVEEGDRGGAVEAGDGEAEVEVLVVDLLAGDAVEVGGVLGIGVGLGVEVLDADAALGEVLVFGEEVVDAPHVELEVLRHVVGATGGVVADRDVGGEFADDGLGAFGERVDLLGGEVERLVAEAEGGDEHVAGDDDDGEGADRGGGAGDGVEGAFLTHGLGFLGCSVGGGGFRRVWRRGWRRCRGGRRR